MCYVDKSANVLWMYACLRKCFVDVCMSCPSAWQQTAPIVHQDQAEYAFFGLFDGHGLTELVAGPNNGTLRDRTTKI